MILIKNWSKPKNCHYCPFNCSDLRCSISNDYIDRDDFTPENSECPIIEVIDENEYD